MAGNQVKARGTFKDDLSGPADKAVSKVKSRFAELQKQGAKGLAIGGGVAVATKAFGLLDSAISGTIGFLGQAADAYREDEKSQAQLRTSLEANVQSWDHNADAIERVLASRMKLGFSDDEQRSSLASLVAITHDATKALDVQRTAMDLARLKGLDLATASELLGKVAGGNIGILARYGIVIDKNATSTEALATISKMAAGQAEAYANTTDGKVVAAQVRANEAMEKFGKIAAGIEATVLPPLADAVTEAADAFDRLATSVERGGPDVILGLARLYARLTGNATLSGQALGLVTDAIDAQTKRARDLTDVNAYGERAMVRMANATAKVAGSAADAQDEIEKLRAEFLKTRAAANDLTDELKLLEGAMFGQDVLAGNIAQAQKDLQDILKEGPGSKAPGAWTIWNGKVAEAKQKLFDLQYQQKQTEGPAALEAWLLKQRDAMDKADLKALAYIDTLLRLNGVIAGLGRSANLTKDDLYVPPKGGGGGTSTPKPPPPTPRPGLQARAAGGPVSEGVPVTVGEVGREVFVPASNGTIIPNDKLGGVSVSIGVMHLHGIGSDVSPQAARRFASSVLDAVGQGLREQNARTGRRRVV